MLVIGRWREGGKPAGDAVAGHNYGQGSSREHAAAAPRDLGLRVVLAKGFARIHRQNLINYGVLPLVLVHPEDYDRLRLGLGVADGSRDLVLEKSILLEAGFDELSGVDWNKGCYIGQELTARTKYRGLVKRRLMPVTIAGLPPVAGTPILADGREVGEMRSSHDGRGLALLRIDTGLIGKRLSAGDAVVIPERPNWMRLPEENEKISAP